MTLDIIQIWNERDISNNAVVHRSTAASYL